MRRVLVANRGEIAVRVVRACRDAGLASVAIYAEPDRDSPHVALADEAFALGGDAPATSYLDVGKVLAAAARAGADALHPGYGFLSESADFAQAVIDAGLVWIGPPPPAIRVLADKVAARRVARRVGVPLIPGTARPVSGVAEITAFAARYGFPIAIKAAHGGGGRGLRVARIASEIPGQYQAAAREAVAEFGSGDCFVERYLDRARHVETQCLADRHGSVVVVSTRDCSVQRRHQKLVEEAPAPFLTDGQRAELYRASKAILCATDYVGAGTCEFLVGGDGTISFLEVNTRLQVEHPVSEEITGTDLVQEMFRLAQGEELGYGDPPSRGHAIEFRINGEDPGRDFLPAPGTVTLWQPPSGPGVRLDAGVGVGTVVGPAWDPLLAKLIVTGATREQALKRAARALDEFRVEGIATTLPFHRDVVHDPAFAPGPSGQLAVHTRWTETEFRGEIAPYVDGAADDGPIRPRRETVIVEVDGRRLEVSLPSPFGTPAGPVDPGGARRPARVATPRSSTIAALGDALTAPMQGIVVKLAVDEGQHVEPGELVAVLEAMKMEQPLHAHRSGTVRGLRAEVGAPVGSGAMICRIVGGPVIGVASRELDAPL